MSPPALAQPSQVIDNSTGRPPATLSKVQFDAIERGKLVQILLRDVLRVPYVISPAVLADTSRVSVSLKVPANDAPMAVVRYLRASGFVVDMIGGALYVADAKEAQTVIAMQQGVNPPSVGNPPPVVAAEPEPIDLAADDLVVSAILAHQPSAEIAEFVQAVFPSIRMANSRVDSPGDGHIITARKLDTLVFAGPTPVVERAIKLVEQLDVPTPSVRIEGAIVEVSETLSKGSALSGILSLFGSKISAGLNVGEGRNASFARLDLGGLEAVFSAIDQDGGATIIAKPSLTALSGATARMQSGSQVPTLGAVNVTEDGGTVQSVEYRDSGIVLAFTPTVRDGGIELAIDQERSSFVPTTNGVNNSPTLNRSASTSTLRLQDGEIVAFAMLDQQTEQNTRKGFFGGLLDSKTSDKRTSNLVLVVRATLEPVPEPEPLQIFRIPAAELGG